MRRKVRKLRRELEVLLGRRLRPALQLDCPTRRYGSDYGGWYISPAHIDPSSIVYSFGVGEDVSFDLALIEAFDVAINAFDPTPRSIEWVNKQHLPAKFKMHPFGVAAVDGALPFYPPQNPTYISHTLLKPPYRGDGAITVPVYRLATIMTRLGHTRIDLLKMDIEGTEYEVIEDLLRSEIPVKQLLVEFHHRWPNVSTSQTKDAIRHLNHAGYYIIAVSETGAEISFLRE